jgi:hypothetical protein
MTLKSAIANISKEDYQYISADTLKMFSTHYTIPDLVHIVTHFNITLTCILTTQKLTADFCKEYILREDELYCQTEGDEYLTVDDVVQWQPHIKREAFDDFDED